MAATFSSAAWSSSFWVLGLWRKPSRLAGLERMRRGLHVGLFVYQMPVATAISSALLGGVPLRRHLHGMAGSLPHRQRHLPNALFGSLQEVTANSLGLKPTLMAAANSSGVVLGKMISSQNIAVATAATGLAADDESKLFRFTLKHSVFLCCVMGLLVLFYTYVAPDLAL